MSQKSIITEYVQNVMVQKVLEFNYSLKNSLETLKTDDVIHFLAFSSLFLWTLTLDNRISIFVLQISQGKSFKFYLFLFNKDWLFRFRILQRISSFLPICTILAILKVKSIFLTSQNGKYKITFNSFDSNHKKSSPLYNYLGEKIFATNFL